jgi:hypothetical protein
LAPHDDRGRAIFRGNEDDDEWRREHSDEITEIPATYERSGVTFIGVATAYSDDPQGTGSLEWDHTWPNPHTEMLTHDDSRLGWYRLAAHLRARMMTATSAGKLSISNSLDLVSATATRNPGSSPHVCDRDSSS